jgi:nicotinamidase-related amidase
MNGFHKDDTTIFSIDMNNGFAKAGKLYSKRVEALIGPTAEFFKIAKAEGIKIIGITDSHPANALEFDAYPPHCLVNTGECEIVDELKDYMDSIVAKNSTNCFFALNYDYVSDHKYIITGCCTDICIFQFATTLRAYLNQNNIRSRVIVPQNLVDTFDTPGHPAERINETFFKSMKDNGIEIYPKIL